MRRFLGILALLAALLVPHTVASQVPDVSSALPRLTAQSCQNERQLKANPLASAETSVRFINRRIITVRLYRLDPVGLRQLVATLPPGTDATQSTSVGTP